MWRVLMGWTFKMLPFSFLNHQPTQNLIGRYVAVAVSADFTQSFSAYSDDKGLTWALGDNPPPTLPRVLAYGNGIFMCISGNVFSGWSASISLDGKNFLSPVLIPFSPIGYDVYSLAYMDNVGLWVVSLGPNSSLGVTNQYATSSDNGATWTIRTMPKAAPWSAAYGNGVLVATNHTNATNNIAYTTNGITWTSQTFNQTRLFRNTVFLPSYTGLGGTFILNGQAGNPRSAISSASVPPSWSAPATGTAAFWKTAGLSPYTIGSPVSCWTINVGSTSWRYGIDTARTNPQNSAWESIATDNDITADKSFVAVASSGARRIARTTGSNNFTMINDPALNSLYFTDVAFGEVV